MNTTERLYEHNSYCREFEATVESCSYNDGFYNVVLNRTAFFPEGGGQAADSGTINDIEVFDVQREGDIIVHKTKTELPVGKEVVGKIDWDLRFSRMQSHAGEHIVSGIVHSVYGYSNVGFHMGSPVMTVDFDGPLSKEDIDKVELLSNRAIYENAPIVASYPSKEELSMLQYRSKIELGEDTRLITIGNIDCCACCAPHPSNTGEIGLVKIIDYCPYKKGTRIEMVAGINAFTDYSALNESNKNLMGLLSAPRHGVKEAVCKQSELIHTLRSENQRMSRMLALYELNPTKICDSAYSISRGLSYDELRYCANSLMENGVNTCVLLSETDDENYIYFVSSNNSDVKMLVEELNAAFNGKGGGRGNCAQGKILASSEESIRLVVEKLLQKDS